MSRFRARRHRRGWAGCYAGAPWPSSGTGARGAHGPAGSARTRRAASIRHDGPPPQRSKSGSGRGAGGRPFDDRYQAGPGTLAPSIHLWALTTSRCRPAWRVCAGRNVRVDGQRAGEGEPPRLVAPHADDLPTGDNFARVRGHGREQRGRRRPCGARWQRVKHELRRGAEAAESTGTRRSSILTEPRV